MSNTDFRSAGKETAQELSEKLQQTGEDVKQRASDAYNATADAARERFDQFGTAASQAAEKVQHVGADYAIRFADNIRGAAKSFEQDSPIAARTIELAAGYVEDAAEKIRDGSMSDAIEGVTSFARRRPATFLGLSVLAGFAVISFLKSSSSNQDERRS